MLPGCTPWPNEFARHYRAKGYWGDILIPRLFNEMAAKASDRIAVIEGDARATLADFCNGSDRLAAHFHRIGLGRGDRVVFQLPNSIGFFTTFLALLRIGAIPVMALPPHRETELVHFARSSGATALFVPERIRDFDFRPMANAVQCWRRHCGTSSSRVTPWKIRYRWKGLQRYLPSKAMLPP